MPDAAHGVAGTALVRSARAGAGRDENGDDKPHFRSEFTAGQVSAMAAVGFRLQEIAIALDIRPRQITEHYARELEAAPIGANLEVAMKMLALAKSGANFKAMQFWLERRAGWVKPEAVQVHRHEHLTVLGNRHAAGRARVGAPAAAVDGQATMRDVPIADLAEVGDVEEP